MAPATEKFEVRNHGHEQTPDCPACDGNGRVYNNADPSCGQWVACEECSGITLYRVTVDGRNYEIDVHPAKRAGYPISQYAQIFRLRKDGSRGRQIQSWQDYGVHILNAAGVP